MNFEHFITIYPSYLDATKTIKQGRRIPQDLAVPTPTVSDISLILQRHNYRHVLQPYKGYSRDSSTLWDNPGRVKVDCETTKKMELLKLLAAEIPNLPERQARLAQEAKEKELEEQKALEEANQARRLAEAKKLQAAPPLTSFNAGDSCHNIRSTEILNDFFWAQFQGTKTQLRVKTQSAKMLPS